MAKKLKMKMAYCPICNKEHALELLGSGFLMDVSGNMTYVNEDFYRCPEQPSLSHMEEHFEEMIDTARKRRETNENAIKESSSKRAK